jgi:hypothetical protein
VACPFFMPTEKFENGAWPHPARLPLGQGWTGQCGAPGHEGELPSQHELQEFCNLGYAETCSRLPQERLWDSVRFDARPLCKEADGKAQSGTSLRIQIRYICERAHRPVEHGLLEFDSMQARWNSPHPEPRLQRLADCFLAAYLEKKKNQEINRAAAS